MQKKTPRRTFFLTIDRYQVFLPRHLVGGGVVAFPCAAEEPAVVGVVLEARFLAGSGEGGLVSGDGHEVLLACLDRGRYVGELRAALDLRRARRGAAGTGVTQINAVVERAVTQVFGHYTLRARVVFLFVQYTADGFVQRRGFGFCHNDCWV